MQRARRSKAGPAGCPDSDRRHPKDPTDWICWPHLGGSLQAGRPDGNPAVWWLSCCWWTRCGFHSGMRAARRAGMAVPTSPLWRPASSPARALQIEDSRIGDWRASTRWTRSAGMVLRRIAPRMVAVHCPALL